NAEVTYVHRPDRAVVHLLFFSSRRRHTRFSRDWSSDVCSSDLHHLAAQNLSNRAIGRRLGMHHTTVGRILRTTRAPERTTPEQPERTTPAPATTPERTTPPTSGAAPAPRLLLPLDPDLIQDLNVLRSEEHTSELQS